ncbi:MAG TPA: UDP-2,4-diacetamido-2,4,6-trideoxy-beta-L-altropyranose hydrolase [Acidimicrobiia bacterium]|nr:UDP-2,4-diacetamido-2,4,6-trideoxy-beta-L-altropyranose hydrolase [Acidimicrobiia bacterium]
MTIVLRADAGPAIGAGHVMRSLTLGRALVQRGAEVTLVSHRLPPGLRTRAQSCAIETVEVVSEPGSDRDIETVHSQQPTFVMVDGYHLGADYCDALIDGGMALGVFDDNGESAVPRATLVLNQNLHASAALYPQLPAGALLLGARFALLRPEVLAARSHRVERERRNRVLLAFGGSDPSRLTEPVLRELVDTPGIEIRIASGLAAPTTDAVVALVRQLRPGAAFAGSDLSYSFAWADVAVIGAGTMLWELAYLGIPAIAVIIADNQVAGASAAAEAGFVDVIDARADNVAPRVVDRLHELLTNPNRCAAMTRAGHATFDGEGARRIADAIFELVRV